MIDEKLGEKWIIEDMTIVITPKQLLDAILSVADISLGKADCHVESVAADEKSPNWIVKIKGSE